MRITTCAYIEFKHDCIAMEAQTLAIQRTTCHQTMMLFAPFIALRNFRRPTRACCQPDCSSATIGRLFIGAMALCEFRGSCSPFFAPRNFFQFGRRHPAQPWNIYNTDSSNVAHGTADGYSRLLQSSLQLLIYCSKTLSTVKFLALR